MQNGRTAAFEGLFALCVGAAVFALLALCTPMVHACTGMGMAYQAMSVDPWALPGDHPHRLLSPLLANLLGLHGERYWRFCHGTNVFFLATVCWACRRLQAQRFDAALVTAAIGCSGAVGLYTTFLVGFSDTVTFTLLLATALAVRRAPLAYGLHLLNLCNHEQALFFTPLLLYLRHHVAHPRWTREALWLATALALYAALRLLISAHAPAEKLTVDYYVQTSHFPWGFLGLAVLATADSLILFGPLLLLVFWAARQPRWRFENRAAGLLVLTIYAILAVAYDFPRFVSFLFLPVGAASLRYLHGGNTRRFAFVGLVVSMVLGGNELNRTVVPPIYLAMAECGVLENPHQFGACVVPKTLHILVWFGAALLLLAAAGVALARWQPATDRGRS